jgi:hypothetical protein
VAHSPPDGAATPGPGLLTVSEQAGYSEEVGWIKQILSWPVEWSALHGIAEVKSPIIKIATRTDSTASKYVVRWTGTDYPDEGAVGLRFPYHTRGRRVRAEGRGTEFVEIIRPTEESTGRQSWHYTDNGFRHSRLWRSCIVR